MIRYLIIDDEFIAHDIIKEYAGLLPNLVLIQQCYDALEALNFLNNNKVDLIFLDLNMPKISGFEFLRTLSDPPKVIVTTAYLEHAIEGYELNIVDYLLKPFSFERFLKAINKVSGLDAPSQPAIKPTLNIDSKTIFLRSNKKYIQVALDHILYIEAAGNYTKVILPNEMITIREKISDLINQLDKQDFLQVHKSYAVAIKHIKSIEGNIISIGEHTVPIGKYYKMQVNTLVLGQK